jgi:hypothetical protein
MTVDARFADAGQLAEQFERLSAGQRLVYATGPGSLAAFDNPVIDQVRRWRDVEGKATTAQGRDPRDAARTMHFVYRVGSSEAAPRQAEPGRDEGQAGAKVPPLPDRFPFDGRRMLAALANCAAMGQPCPNNEGLADLLELESPRRARTLFDLLVKHHQIKVIECARYGPRVVEVAASGKRTALVEAARG